MNFKLLLLNMGNYESQIKLIGKMLLFLAACIFISWLSGLIWDKLVGRLARRTSTELDGKLVSASHRPLVIMVFLVSLQHLLKYLSIESVLQGLIFLNSMQNILYTAITIVMAIWADSVIQAAVEWYSGEYTLNTQGSLEQFLPLVRQLMRFLVYFIALTYIMDHFGINITGLIATAGVASLAIALAAQETLSNMFAGLMIMIDRPFRVGDRIELEKDLLGDVIQIGTRTTKILKLDNTVIVVPNKELANSRIINYVYPTPQVNIRLKIGVAYDSELSAVKSILSEILSKNPMVMNDPAPGIYFTDFGESSLNLLIICWVEDFKDRFTVIDELNIAIKEKFEKAGIVIPYPRRDISLIPGELAENLEKVSEARRALNEAAAGRDQ